MNSLLFYIGNGLVKCAMVHYAKGKMPEVLFWEKVDINHPDTLGQEELKKVTLTALEQLSENSKARLLAPAIKDKKIKKIFCILSAPWYVSATKLIKTTKLEPFLIKDDTVMESIKASEAEEEKSQGDMIEVLERKIVRVSLNGYITENPIGKRANTLEVSVVLSHTDKNFLNNIRETIDRYFTIDEKHFHSLPLASFAVLRDTLKHQENLLMINITSLLTEVSLVKDSFLHETVTLPIGSQKIIEMATSRLNVTEAVAATLLNLYQADHVESGVSAKLKGIIDEFKKLWTESLGQAFSHLSAGVSLPSSCYLFCQTPMRNFFSGFIAPAEYPEFALIGDKFKIETISEATFSTMIKFNSQPPDSSVAIMAFFANINL